MSEISLNELLEKIKDESLKRAGRGFTVEINAEVTTHHVYRFKQTSFFEDIFQGKMEGTWKLDRTVTTTKYLSQFQRRREDVNYYDLIEVVDWEISVSQQIQNQLPQGVLIQKTAPTVLYDGRDFRLTWPYADRKKVSSIVPPSDSVHRYYHLEHRRRLSPSFNNDRGEINGRKTCYIVGRRVYLTVSDVYSSRILDEECKSKYPFRNYLLAKYDQILRDLASKWNFHWGKGEICIGFSDIRVRGRYDDGYEWTTISFKDYDKASLRTYEQLYGMAIALIDTKKKLDPAWRKANYTIRGDNASICIHVIESPPDPKKEPTIPLKEW